MDKKDTVSLLKECDSGTKMAVSSFDEVLEKISDSKLKTILRESKERHEALGNEIHSLLLSHHSEEKDPNPMAKGMSWLKTNFKIEMEHSDAVIADLITDGCDMGVKSLCRYLNQYQAADQASKDICRQIISQEEKLRQQLQDYL